MAQLTRAAVRRLDKAFSVTPLQSQSPGTETHAIGRTCKLRPPSKGGVQGLGCCGLVSGKYSPRDGLRSTPSPSFKHGLHGRPGRSTSARAAGSLAVGESGEDRGYTTDEEAKFPGVSSDEQGNVTMAEAFNVPQRAVTVVITGICLSAVLVPLLCLTTATGPTFAAFSSGSLRIRVLAYLTMLVGFYMAWNIGANDVANAMGTSVGSGALSLRQAVLMAAVLEFSGAFLVGSHVTHTMQNGIIDSAAFGGQPAILFCGMLAALASSGTWLQVASYFGWPVSTTHSIIGAMVGFGICYGGFNAVYWGSLGRVVGSWVVSPVLGALVSFVVYKSIRTFVYRADRPGLAACRAAPVAVFTGVVALSVMSSKDFTTRAFLQSSGIGALGALAISFLIKQQLGNALEQAKAQEPATGGSRTGGPTGIQLKIVYKVFGYLQVLSACFMSFAHGANDVANAIGPISAALAILQTASGATSGVISSGVSTGVLAWGGFGIVAGLLVWGYRVIATIGKKITELTPTRGFAAEFAAATVVVLASRLGLPVSATHTLVGAVMGVGFARGLGSIHTDTVKSIVLSWVITIPLGASLAVVYAAVLTRLVPIL